MSAYIRRWCVVHGDWEMDVDNPGECEECVRLGLTELQLVKAENVRLTADRDALLKALKALQPILWNDGPLGKVHEDLEKQVVAAIAQAER